MLVYLFKVIMDILYAFHIEQRFPINMHITFANRLVRKNIDQDLIILNCYYKRYFVTIQQSTIPRGVLA